MFKDKETCSNASDFGSEDTFMSLGTKIKARAQLSPKPKGNNLRNIQRYRNIAKKGFKHLDTSISETGLKQSYGMEVKITERPQSPTKNKNMFHERSPSPTKTRPYESYFIPFEGDKKDCESFSRVSFDSNIQEEVEHAIKSYSKRLSKQQLSLVEEESTQDVDSIPSQNLSSLSPTNSLEDAKDHDSVINNGAERNNFSIDDTYAEYYKLPNNSSSAPKSYSTFYKEFHTDACQNLSSTMVHTDTSSKDSGYQENGTTDDKLHRQNYSLPTTSLLKKSEFIEQSKSLDNFSTNINDKKYTSEINSQWDEPMNHSRLLYKDFFLKKEGHITLPPQNSPSKEAVTISGIKENAEHNIGPKNEELDYPSYLINSTTKAYTSKVIEDYKKELQAINNLHELTIKDIKIDAISPTPLNIDKLFENHNKFTDNTNDNDEKKTYNNPVELDKNKNALDNSRKDIMKISTKDLISNYFKVKEGDFKGKLKKKTNNLNSKEEITSEYNHEWNNKTKSNTSKTIPVFRNQTERNMFSAPVPLSARIESVQNDKDIDSWMSLSATSPSVCEIQVVETAEQVIETPDTYEDSNEPNQTVCLEKESDSQNQKELTSNSTVLDIYSMLKEIESYGDNPVTSVTNVVEDSVDNKVQERTTTPKDNFM